MRKRPHLRVLPAVGLITALTGFFLGPATPAGATYPGDNGRIAFESSRGLGSDMDIWTVRPDGSGLLQLTANFDEDRDPAWSSDGETIAFASNRGPGSDYDIYTMPGDGSGSPVQLNNDPGDQRNPTWSPDDLTVAFETPSTNVLMLGSSVIGTVATPSPLNAITELSSANFGCIFVFVCGADDDAEPAWSPDGNLIAFARDLGVPSDIYTINPATGTSSEALAGLVAGRKSAGRRARLRGLRPQRDERGRLHAPLLRGRFRSDLLS